MVLKMIGNIDASVGAKAKQTVSTCENFDYYVPEYVLKETYTRYNDD